MNRFYSFTCSRTIQEVFEIVKALPGISIFENIAEFDAYLAARQRMIQEGK